MPLLSLDKCGSQKVLDIKLTSASLALALTPGLPHVSAPWPCKCTKCLNPTVLNAFHAMAHLILTTTL